MDTTALAPEPIAEVTAESLDLSPSQVASQGDSVTAYREAKALEKANPELKRPFPTTTVEKPAIEAKTTEPRGTSKRQQATNESIRQATERAVAEKDAEIARLRSEMATRQPITEPAKPTAAQVDEYDRYLALPDAPKVADFQSKGKTYEQFTAAMQIFIADKRDSERTERQREQDFSRAQMDRERSRAAKVEQDFKSDPEFKAALDTAVATNQWPANSPVSREVLGLQTIHQLTIDNAERKRRGIAEVPITAYNVIAEELVESDQKVALARHLSKPGELARLAALPDARSLLRAIRDIERDVSTPKTVKTTTQAGEPAITLTSSRATDPLDDESAAIRSGDQARYNEIKREKRLRKAGLLR